MWIENIEETDDYVIIHRKPQLTIPEDEHLGTVEQDWIDDDMEWFQNF
jgi:hypothetical protein